MLAAPVCCNLSPLLLVFSCITSCRYILRLFIHYVFLQISCALWCDQNIVSSWSLHVLADFLIIHFSWSRLLNKQLTALKMTGICKILLFDTAQIYFILLAIVRHWPTFIDQCLNKFKWWTWWCWWWWQLENRVAIPALQPVLTESSVSRHQVLHYSCWDSAACLVCTKASARRPHETSLSPSFTSHFSQTLTL